MDSHFLRSYVDLLIQTCHRRGIHAMGGMAAQIPIKNDPAANQAALEKVRQDKLREVWAGHDGTWVAHPGLVPVAREVFDTYMPFPNQIDKKPVTESRTISSADLLTVPEGAITQEGLNRNIDVGLQYLATWLCGNGCVPIYNLMEDAATAEISRAQVWQWIKYEASPFRRPARHRRYGPAGCTALRRAARLSIPGARTFARLPPVRGGDDERGVSRIPHPGRLRDARIASASLQTTTCPISTGQGRAIAAY